MQIPLDPKIKDIKDIPYTLSYIIRKRQQLDSLAEMPKDKRPPEDIIWDGTTEDIDKWVDKVYKTTGKNDDGLLYISDIEG